MAPNIHDSHERWHWGFAHCHCGGKGGREEEANWEAQEGEGGPDWVEETEVFIFFLNLKIWKKLIYIYFKIILLNFRKYIFEKMKKIWYFKKFKAF